MPDCDHRGLDMVAAVLPTLMTLLQRSAEYLSTHGIANARRESEWIFSAVLRLSRLELYTRFDMPLEDADVGQLRSLVQRRGKREPLAYVLGNQEFHGLTLQVGPGVLVPRPETEELVELVLHDLPKGAASRVLDLGTGSGAIAVAIKQARPTCQVEASDVSAEALTIARGNAQRLTLEVGWHLGHLAQGVTGPFDVVIANLPYVGEQERGECDPELAYEPALALFSGADGLDLIKELLADVPRILAPTGVLWLEHGWRQGKAITQRCHELGYGCTVLVDLAKKERFSRIQLLAVVEPTSG
jgi:release factor glutamine methyltransferase